MYTTDRLILRAYQPKDDEHLLKLTNNLQVQIMQRRDPVSPTSSPFITDTVVKKCLEGAYFHAIVTPKSDPDTFIGYVVLVPPMVPKNRDAMYVISLLPEFGGQGYGTEVTRFVVDWGFRMGGLHRIWLGVYTSNKGAIRVYEKAGFVSEGIARKENWVNGKWEDSMMMSILDEEWEQRQAEQAQAQ